MHELSVCQGLVNEVARVAAAHGASRVTRIAVAVGPLSGVEAPLLERAFAVARAGTVADAAVLVTEATEVAVWCESCGAETVTAPNRLVCERCGGWRVEVRRGAELLLTSIDIED
ncbi:MAG TPA: hydrogenase maturation nickel metallochaperone HypA [Usitatibacter sp.]|nr:hydrogenase maturation nickel metallochaperone HypA [Usitatibacter sp.]